MADMIEIIDHTNTPRFLMPLESMKLTKAFKTFGEDAGSPPLIPRDKWKPISLKTFSGAIKDQDGVGACNAFATVTATETAYGLCRIPCPPLSTGYLYGNINGQRDQGSLLEDAIEWMNKYGTVPASVVGMLDWQKSKWPANAAAIALNYRVLEWWWCPTFDHFASALQYGFAGNIGMMWGSGDNPNANGYLPDRATGRAGGHAIAVDGLCYDAGWGLELPNSWSPGWGVQGRFKLSETRVKNEVGNFGWFVVRAINIPSDAASLPQLAV